MLLLLLLFILVPIAELYVIVQIGGAIGIVPTLALLVIDALLGSMLLRQQGRAAWVRFNRALAENRLPHKEVFDGVLIVFGGALLLTPGFITDVFGLVLLIPPTRALIRGFLARLLGRRGAVAFRVAEFGYARRPGAGGGSPPPARAYDYEGTASEVDEPADELEPGPTRDGRA